ncbi:MAG: zinc ribbon domain-containing protein [Anaerolineales bacterium]|nr:zinc ribbon domain-containing protein [Anaerolineales bacterium]
MRKLFFILALIALFFLPIGAGAKPEIKFSSVSVQLWPEFDKPSMLVIYEIALSADTALPLDLNFRMPAAGTLHVIAVGSTPETVSDTGVVYEVDAGSLWSTVSIKSVSQRVIRIEYYDNLEKQGNARHYLYRWPSDYAVDSFAIRFQMPVDASGLQTVPALNTSFTGDFGLTYYAADFGSLPAGQEFTLEVDYQKTTDTLSVSSPNIQPAENLANATGRVTLAKYVLWVLGGLGILLILFALAGGLVYWQGRVRGPSAEARKRHAPRREANGEQSGAIYCHQCGRRAQPGDVFCRACGTRLRRGEQ